MNVPRPASNWPTDTRLIRWRCKTGAGLLALLLSTDVAAQTITATPSPRHSVTIVTVTPVTVSVTGGPGNIRDFVALYSLGSVNYFDWFYTDGTKTKAAKGRTNGTVTFMAPRAGQYEAKFWSLTDAGIATLLKAVPLSVIPTPIEIDGVDLTVTRKPDGNTDDISITIQAGKGTAVVSQSTPVKVDNKLVSPGP